MDFDAPIKVPPKVSSRGDESFFDICKALAGSMC